MSEPGQDLEVRARQETALGELRVRDEVLDLLLEKIANDRYPSTTMLDDVESLLTPWRIQDYAQVLLDKVRQDRFPSRSMVQRLLRLSG